MNKKEKKDKLLDFDYYQDQIRLIDQPTINNTDNNTDHEDINKNKWKIKEVDERSKIYLTFHSFFLFFISIGLTTIVSIVVSTISFKNPVYEWWQIIVFIVSIFVCVILSFLFCILFWKYIFKNKKEN